jgi:5'-3' exonuclease
LPTGVEKLFKHRTAFKQYMLEKSTAITEDYEVQDVQKPEPIAFVLSTIKNHINRIIEEVKPVEVVIYTGEEDNFRKRLALPSEYKGNRKGLRPVHLAEAKKYLQDKYKAPRAIGYEVDDACSIAAYNAVRAGKEAVMYFYEKDQYQLDGVTLLYDNDKFEYQKVPELGELRLEKDVVKGLGLKFLAYQWVCSDPVDTYCAYEASSVKFGAKSAYKLLKDCQTEVEVLQAVILQFKKFYPEKFEYIDWFGNSQKADWETMLRLYYKCARMMRSNDDRLDCFDLFNKYGVEI